MGLTATAAVVVVGGVALSELLHWRAGHRYLPAADEGAHSPSSPPAAAGGRARGTAVIVLGYPPRPDGSIRPMARWRVEMAKRAYDRLAADIVVFSGGPHPGVPAEASVMTSSAAEMGIPAAAVRAETSALSTWQNIAFCIPMVENYGRLAVISDPMHAARGRRDLLAQRPDLAARLVSGGEYQFLERWWLKVPATAYELTEMLKLAVPPPVRRQEWAQKLKRLLGRHSPL